MTAPVRSLLPVPSLAGRRVLITGAARGIGAGLAERLHQRRPHRPVQAGGGPLVGGRVLPMRMAGQPIVDRYTQRNLPDALRIARAEHAPFTTPQPEQLP